MTAPIGPQSQYATAKQFYDKAGTGSSNLSGSPEDADRLRAYALYEDMYFNRPEMFKVFLRGDDEDSDPVYVPTAKKIVEAMNRFLCKDFTFVVSTTVGDPAVQNELTLRLNNLFKREEVVSKFSNQKRFGLVRGDAMWYIVGDPNKDQWSRLSIYELNPSNYFPILDPVDKNRTLGCHIVEVIRDPREKDDKSKTVARRRTYLKGGVSWNSTTGQYEQGATAPGVWTEVTHWEIGKWDDRNLKEEDMERVQDATVPDVPMMQLPAQITSLPIYHWKNHKVPDSPFGLSELSGIETLIAGINQALTDEQITLIIQGLGVYMTDSKAPINSDGTPGNWILGPGIVAEVAAGSKFERVNGVGSVAPYQEHIQELKNDAQEASGIPDIAAGKVDVTVAESGISLQLQLAPILASSKEKQEDILGTMDHMLYDLVNMWFPAYEGASFEGVTAYTSVGDAMPINREARIQEVLLLFTSNLITIAMAQAELAKYGYDFQAGDDIKVLKEAAALAAANSEGDNRYAQELEAKERTLNEGAGKLPPGFAPADASPGQAAAVGAL